MGGEGTTRKYQASNGEQILDPLKSIWYKIDKLHTRPNNYVSRLIHRSRIPSVLSSFARSSS